MYNQVYLFQIFQKRLLHIIISDFTIHHLVNCVVKLYHINKLQMSCHVFYLHTWLSQLLTGTSTILFSRPGNGCWSLFLLHLLSTALLLFVSTFNRSCFVDGKSCTTKTFAGTISVITSIDSDTLRHQLV